MIRIPRKRQMMTEEQLEKQTSSLLERMATPEQKKEIRNLTKEKLLKELTPEENQLLAMVPQQMQDKIFKVLGME